MRFATLLMDDGFPTVVVEHEGHLVEVRSLVPEVTSFGELAAGGAGLLDAITAALSEPAAVDGVPLGAARLGPAVPTPGKIIAVGLNYRAHAEEVRAAAPARPLLFAKFPTAVLEPAGVISWDPRLTRQVDYEAELGVVIGRRARRVQLDDALDYVFGYTCINDVSARDLQSSDGQWVRAKSLDTFCPIGPVVVTPDEIQDPQTLRITCSVNGEVLQDASTADMFFTVRELVAFCSESFTLEPGDVIATGTPSGIGLTRTPPRFLADGDEVAVEIERIGRLVNYAQPLRDAVPA